MPSTAQDRHRRGPLAALLILFSLFLASGVGAGNGSGLRPPAARLGSSRPNAAAALLPPGTRNPLDDEAPAAGADPSLLPSGPGVVTERLWARPAAEASSRASDPVPPPTATAYRARAPPAS